MSKVFILDQNKQPLDPVHPGYARKLLGWGKVAVYRQYPFTLILKETSNQPGTRPQTQTQEKAIEDPAGAEDTVVVGVGSQPQSQPQPLRLKLDPGSKTTGLAVINDTTGEVVWAAELQHRGQQVRDALLSRRAIRRNRRARHTRYRPARFLNRRRKEGWLPPSLESRLANTLTWVKRLVRLAPIQALSQELVRFDTQLMQNPEIAGVEYQQGELAGYEVRQYLLEKWGRKCVYCGASGVPLQVEHIVPKARGGSNRVSNLTLACVSCNVRKGTQTASEFGHPHLQDKARQPLKDAAAVNTTRWALYERLKATGLPVEVGSGGLTKFNRSKRGLTKTHWLDAACVGKSTPLTLLQTGQVKPLLIRASGHGNRAMCRTDKYGFPRLHRTRHKSFFGFQTGDMAKVVVPKSSKKAGTYTGRVAVRASGSFDLTAGKGTVGKKGKVSGISHRYFTMLHRSDGYTYSFKVI